HHAVHGGPVADRASKPTRVVLEDGTETFVDHGHVVIAAITSCTNTSNPQVMIGAALLAKKAVERGLTSKPWVKTTLAPGSKVVDLNHDPLGQDPEGNDVFLHDIWPSPQEVQRVIDEAVSAEMFSNDYADVFAGTEQWQNLPTPTGDTFAWDPESTYVRRPPYFEGMPAEPTPVQDITGARTLAVLGDSVTTDHISPAGS